MHKNWNISGKISCSKTTVFQPTFFRFAFYLTTTDLFLCYSIFVEQEAYLDKQELLPESSKCNFSNP